MKTKLKQSDKKFFFEGLKEIQQKYNELIETSTFQEAEEFKIKSVSNYILENENDLLRIRSIIFKGQNK